jgi:hypothetical protein
MSPQCTSEVTASSRMSLASGSVRTPLMVLIFAPVRAVGIGETSIPDAIPPTDSAKNTCFNWTSPCWRVCSGFTCCFTCDCIREICAIRGQKQNRIFTTDSADNADESQRLQKVCSGLKNQCSRVSAPCRTDKLNLERGAVQLSSDKAVGFQREIRKKKAAIGGYGCLLAMMWFWIFAIHSLGDVNSRQWLSAYIRRMSQGGQHRTN